MQLQRDAKRLSDGLVRDIVVSNIPWQSPSATASRSRATRRSRGSDPARGNDKVIILGHAPCRFDNLLLVVGNDLDPAQIDSQREAELCKIGLSRTLAASAIAHGKSNELTEFVSTV